MRPTEIGEVVFEDTLEACTMAQFVIDADRADLLEGVIPPIVNPSISEADFQDGLSFGQVPRGDGVEYVCSAAVSKDVIDVLFERVEIVKGWVPRTRERYMGQRLLEFGVKVLAMEPTPVEPNVVEIEGLGTVFGVTDEQADLVRRREAFVNQAVTERGWNVDDMSIDQLLEIRRLPGWENPPALG